MVLLLVFMHLTRDLFAIAKFLLYTGLHTYCTHHIKSSGAAASSALSFSRTFDTSSRVNIMSEKDFFSSKTELLAQAGIDEVSSAVKTDTKWSLKESTNPASVVIRIIAGIILKWTNMDLISTSTTRVSAVTGTFQCLSTSSHWWSKPASGTSIHLRDSPWRQWAQMDSSRHTGEIACVLMTSPYSLKAKHSSLLSSTSLVAWHWARKVLGWHLVAL